MSPIVWVIIIVVIIILIAFGVVAWRRNQQKTQVREQFGPEYERVAQETGSERKARSELQERQDRVQKLNIHPLAPAARDRFAQSWQTVQSEFVDDPGKAVADADRLVGDVMEARGYPVEDFEQRATDISVEHPDLVQNYRQAHDVANRNVRGEASTEDLRQSVVQYRALFDELLGKSDSEQQGEAQ